MKTINIGTISLGCDKNRVDTERVLYELSCYDNVRLVNDAISADVVLINTCAFIKSAVEESIANIFDMVAVKEQKPLLIIVMGCMAERYAEALSTDILELTAVVHIRDYSSIAEIISSHLGVQMYQKGCKTCGRIMTLNEPTAYLKIAEGCDNFCSYCTIPYIRGRYRSDTIESIVDEAKFLLDTYPVKELDIVAQDVTRYGKDLYGEYSLIRLLDELSKLDVVSLRLNYCYPELVTRELVRYVAGNDKMCKYLDIPLQHSEDAILRSMRRRTTADEQQAVLDMIRTECPSMSLRSTFIVGYPGETQEQFDSLLTFIRRNRLDNMGFFSYSREEGTKAYVLPNQIPAAVKKKRLSAARAVASEIMHEDMAKRLGQPQTVLVDSIDYEKGLFCGHTQYDAPSVDKKTYFTSSRTVAVGEYTTVIPDTVKRLDFFGHEVVDD